MIIIIIIINCFLIQKWNEKFNEFTAITIFFKWLDIEIILWMNYYESLKDLIVISKFYIKDSKSA